MATGTVPVHRPGIGPEAGRRPIWLYVLTAMLAVVACAYQVHITVDQAGALLHPTAGANAPFFVSATLAVVSLSPEAQAAGLRVGDRVMQIDGRPLTGGNSLQRSLSEMHAGTRASVMAMRHGKPMRFDVVLRASQAIVHPAVDIASEIAIVIVMPWLATLLGLYVVAARPRERLAWIVCGVLLSFSALVNTPTFFWGDWIRVPAETYRTSLTLLWPLFMFLFGYYFPQTLAIDSRKPWLKWIVIAPYLVLAAVGIPFQVLCLENVTVIRGLIPALTPLFLVSAGFSFVAIGIGIALLIWKGYRAPTPDARRRIRLLVAGIVVSLLPLLGILLFALATHRYLNGIPVVALIVASSFLVLFPLTLAYVILVNRAMDVSVAIRQGLRYAFARGGIVVLRVLSLVVFAFIGYSLATRYVRSPSSQVMLAAVLFGAVILANWSFGRLGLWVDRRFFREQYNAERVLVELSEQVSRIREPRLLLEMVCDRISQSLHIPHMAAVLARDGSFETTYVTGFDQPPAVRLSSGSGLVRYLRGAGEAQRVYFDDESSWLYRTPGIEDEERACLAYLGAELLLPLSSRGDLLGFIAAGQKRSEQPYSKLDVRLLSSVANQAGLALENAELTNAIASEMAQRERLAREVEIAREVQERLFPQTVPALDGMDCAGHCRTAFGVGGDYYDFLLLPDGRFGFAVADVAGKGISAALLMASLQASLRGEISHGTEDLAAIMTQLNHRVYEASATNRYATFFFGRYAPVARRLDYVNAGHNPPILMRRAPEGWQTTLLDASGTVIGLLPNVEYSQRSLDLLPGDYLVAYTDGISEAMNHAEDEWGEERLAETVRACAESSLSAAETVNRILSAADTFTAGARQHDDMTLVVLRIR